MTRRESRAGSPFANAKRRRRRALAAIKVVPMGSLGLRRAAATAGAASGGACGRRGRVKARNGGDAAETVLSLHPRVARGSLRQRRQGLARDRAVRGRFAARRDQVSRRAAAPQGAAASGAPPCARPRRLRTPVRLLHQGVRPLGYVSRRPNNHGEARESRERRFRMRARARRGDARATSCQSERARRRTSRPSDNATGDRCASPGARARTAPMAVAPRRARSARGAP